MNYETVRTETILMAQTEVTHKLLELFEQANLSGNEKFIKGKLGDTYLQLYDPSNIVVGSGIIVRLEQKQGDDFLHKRCTISTIAHKQITFPEWSVVMIPSETVLVAIEQFC